MRNRLLAALIAALLFAPGSTAQTPSLLALKAARLIDGKSPSVLTNAVILVEADKIKSVASNLAIPDGAKIIDLGDSTLLPGLIDGCRRADLRWLI
jgi:imidazolonepropionase-like amidohydrolase